MEQQTEDLWLRLKPIESDDERIAQCYRLLFARSVTQQELEIAHAFLPEHADVTNSAPSETENKWKDYLQALMGLNEFHFVD